MKKFLILILVILPSFLDASQFATITIDGGIGPAVHTYIKRAIEDCEDDNYDGLIIKLNTPGGLLESTRDIVSEILESEVPIIVYVSPSGSRAGSAGVFITLSANIAVMAPGTNMGSAHPVGMGGEMSDSASVMSEKVTNDAAAFVRTIAQKRGRNEEWAEKAVRESISDTENECYEQGVIDLIAPSIDSLMKGIDGFPVETSSGEIILNTQDYEIVELDMDWKEEFLMVISDPNVAYIFIMLAIYGIFFELYSPGSIFPGVIGGISAILAAYSLQMLPVNYIGIAFMLLAIILFVVEVFVSSYGLLTIGGVVSFVLGSIMLIDSPVEAMEISTSMIITGTVITAGFFVLITILGLKAQFNKKASGSSTMIGVEGTCVSIDKLQVKVLGEIWKAESDDNLELGDNIRVVDLDGMTLKVEKI